MQDQPVFAKFWNTPSPRRKKVKIEHFLPTHSLVDVKWLKTIAVFGLLGLWLGATNHCKLEEIPGLNFLVCGEHKGSTPHQDNNCDTDGCAQVEDGVYKTEESQVTAAAPTVVLAVTLLTALEEQARYRPTGSDFLTFASPELPVTWQFSFRAALPPRAPSFLS